MAFVPLYLYSGFSYLKSGLPVERIPALAKKRGYEAVGLCDWNSLSGYAPFTHCCKAAGVSPIYGIDLELDGEHYCFYVKDEEGYRNILILALEASRNAASLQLAASHQAGLALVYDLEHSFLKDHFQEDEKELALRLNEKLRAFKNVYLGLPYREKEDAYVAFCRKFAAGHSYPLVAFPHIAYEKKSDAIVTLITEAIQNRVTIEQKQLDGTEYFLSKEEIGAFYKPAEIALTEEVAKSSFSFIARRGTLLHYENEEGLSSEDYLREKAEEGLVAKGCDKPNYHERLDYELGIIHKMGYDDYFLVVADYVHYAKTHGVSVGPGRGSGPASLVSYSLDISTVDPLEHGLLFERFLNPERKSMPDIDVDFSDVTRDQVVAYLQSKYGHDRVGHVLTSQTIGAKEALRDIGRVYGYAEREISLIVSTIQDDRLSLRDDYRKSKPFKNLIDSDKYYLEIVSLASKIEGLPRQAGLHAAGIILNDEPLEKAMPVKDDPSVGYVGCLEKDYLEEQGFLKMDLLGLRNLSVIDRCVELIKQSEGITLEPAKIPYDDEESIALVRNQETIGLFQLESPGMKRAIAEVQPSTFADIVAIIALFRPGPMEQIPVYARRKKGKEPIVYLSPELEPILSSTYGVIVYQEQIMQIAQSVAGFRLGDADLFRRAISKKDSAALSSYHDKFISGCLANGKSKDLAEKLFDLIYAFANYGFNKAHAVAYGVISCQMAYLKKHYPKEFYCGILDALPTSEAKFKNALSELKRHAIRLALPCINRSKPGFSVDGDALRFPLENIKNLQSVLIRGIYEERMNGGPYTDLFDFVARTKKYGLNQQSLIRLIDAGALDGFGIIRASLRATAFAAFDYANLIGGENGDAMLLDFGFEKPAIVEADPTPQSDLQAEYDALGMMVSGSPLQFYQEEIAAHGAVPIGEALKKRSFVTAGIVKAVRTIVTRKGRQMTFIDLYDDLDEMSLVMWDEEYAKSFGAIKKDKLIILKGHLGERGFVADEAKEIGG